MTAGLDVIRHIDWAMEGIIAAPVIAVRMSNRGARCDEFVYAVNCARWGIGGFDVPRDAGHIRKRAIANRKRNKAARLARRSNR